MLAGLTGCGTLQPGARPLVYDFGPGSLSSSAVNPIRTLTPLVLAEVEATAALDSNAVLYRLGYSDSQQLRPYAQARWSMPPAHLLHQRLREQLGQRRVVLRPEQASGTTLTLRVELEEFSHLFESPERSFGLIRLRATLSQNNPKGESVLVQRNFATQQGSSSSDAAGGVRALALASDALIAEIETWVQQVAAAPTAP